MFLAKKYASLDAVINHLFIYILENRTRLQIGDPWYLQWQDAYTQWRLAYARYTTPDLRTDAAVIDTATAHKRCLSLLGKLRRHLQTSPDLPINATDKSYFRLDKPDFRI